MELLLHLARCRPASRPRIVAVGRFDGVHLGHQRVLRRLREMADRRRGEAVVAVRVGESREPRLMTLRQQLARLDDHGVDGVVLLGGRESIPVAEVVDRLAAAALVTGAPAEGVGCALDLVEPVVDDGVAITAATVRAHVAAGDLAAAERALGRLPAVEGRVVHGFHRGAALGIPTANLRIGRLVLPPDGVYAVRARVRGDTFDGVANIGHNPTFGNEARSVETHLLDFADDLYGARLEVALVARLRGERKFASVEALVIQIRADIAAARVLFAAHVDGV